VDPHQTAALTLFIGLALITARGSAALFDLLHLPPLLGEISGGVLLGQVFLYFDPFGIGRLAGSSDLLEAFATIGLLILLFISGLETKVSDLKHSGKTGILTAFGGAVIPFALGYTAGRLLGLSGTMALLTGAVMVPTSVGVPLGILMEKRMLRTPAGTTILSAAIIDDIIAVVLLTLLLSSGSMSSVALKLVAFTLFAALAGRFLVSPFLSLTEHFPLPMGALTGALVVMFFFAFMAEVAGLAALTGAFVAGLFITERHPSKEVIHQVEVAGYGFFIPLFFVQVGIFLDPASLLRVGGTVLILLAISIAAKFGGAWAGARVGGLSARSSAIVGAGMLPRLEIALIMVALASTQGIISEKEVNDLWTFTLASAVITMTLTPLLLGRLTRDLPDR
jgi:Kef-type K+ transport system membrane component KefB